jgi:DmsE family decaheme c-type cytochrome
LTRLGVAWYAGRQMSPQLGTASRRALCALVLAACVASPGGEGPYAPPAAPPGAEYVGEALCRGCHLQESRHWDDTIHATAFRAAPAGSPGARTCETCHGPGSLHVAAGGDASSLVAFTRDSDDPVGAQNAVCLDCHAQGARLHWQGSVHEAEGLSCSDCHNPMSRTSARALLREPTTNDTCFSCHPAQRSEFRKRSHMPLLEGKLDCADCHQPHGAVADPLLAADTVNALCTQCHPEKRGPFLWEHAPVVESCLNCHRPHGSNRDALLHTSIPFLCQECHAQLGLANHPGALQTRANLATGPRPDERVLNRGCVNCHVQIHGSNHPSGARFHR